MNVCVFEFTYTAADGAHIEDTQSDYLIKCSYICKFH